MTPHTPAIGERVWFAAIVPFRVAVTRVTDRLVYGRQDDAPSWTLDESKLPNDTYPDTADGREALAQWCDRMVGVMGYQATRLREIKTDQVAA